MASMSVRQQPPWAAPVATEGLPQLKVYNSLTRSKVSFFPVDPLREVKWYACGPTVYADAHLGHARNYVTTDILRRILRDYFNYKVRFVMNITDVDDKIILRARQQHLLSNFKLEHANLNDSILDVARTAFDNYIVKNLPRLLPKGTSVEQYNTDLDVAYGAVMRGESLASDGNPPGDQEAKIRMHIQAASAAADALSVASRDSSSFPIDVFYSKIEDILLPHLDSLKGSSVDASDYAIFTKLARTYENRFDEDMRALNVLDADAVTRVTEYVPQIIDFIKRIESNGFAYAVSEQRAGAASLEASFSVYFDITAFEQAGRPYARLEPWNRNNQELQADGEGALAKKSLAGKRSDADFALWKASKSGEPSWPSPWGGGRPGWHIECSAMASDVLGDKIDIHSGGIDLCFPHHDNELAQSEAYWASEERGLQYQWINYFIHMGHLSISGSKMSKSLKNFITIRDALSKGDWTPRALRIVFLLGGWKDGVEITDDLIKASNSWESKVTVFFLKAKDILHQSNSRKNEDATKDLTQDPELSGAFENAKTQLDAALRDSFDTPTAMGVINSLITTANKAVKADDLIIEISKWVTSIVHIFGLDAQCLPEDGIGWSGLEIPESAKPFVYPLSRARDHIRQRAIAGALEPKEVDDVLKSLMAAVSRLELEEKRGDTDGVEHTSIGVDPKQSTSSFVPGNGTQDITTEDTLPGIVHHFRTQLQTLALESAPPKAYLTLCDHLRDTSLWSHNIFLEDRESPLPALIRPLDRDLRAARAEREARDLARAAAKAEREKKEREAFEQGRLSPKEMFKTEEFSEWDEQTGLPTKDKEGKGLLKSREKKLKKIWDKQVKLHEAWLAAQETEASGNKVEGSG